MQVEILQLENLGYSYEEGRHALRNLSVTLYRGQNVAVLGNNGAGKSTFFRCCNGVLHPSNGTISLHGQAITRKKKDTLRLHQTCGLVFQDADSQLIAGTVEAEISFGPMNLRLPETEVHRRVEDAIARMQLEAFRTRAPHYLSGGEKKRVTLADMLAMKPELLFLDEPAASLDPQNTRLLEDHLTELHENGMGLVIATHDVDFAWRWAERVLVFHDGELVADDTPEAVFSEEMLLKRCGLMQPMLFEIGQRYGMHPLPKSIDEMPLMSIPTCRVAK